MNCLSRIPIALLVFSVPIASQTITASLEGVVRDPSGALVPGARVQVVNTATNITTRLETRPDGRFLAPSLPPGSYFVSIEASGFKKVERSGIVLQVNQVARIEIALEVGAVTDTVEITAQAPLLESTSSALGQVVENRSITNLPLNQRNPYALVFLAPGVIGNVGATFNQANISINGGRPGANEILADGIPSSPPLVNPIQGYTVYPSVDSVQEFKVQTNNYSAEFGRSSGGIINLVFKSGTNQLHGSFFEFLRNSKLDSNEFFANSKGLALGSFKRNQFGASGGGPVHIPKLYNGRNRTFWLFAYEGLRERSQSNLLATVPTALQRAGDFSQTLNAVGAQIAIYDPVTTTRSGSGFVRQSFPGNAIPASRIDPVARNVVKYYPLPNLAGDPNTGANNLTLPGTAPTDSNQIDVKGDENINERNRFFVRVSHRNYDLPPPTRFPAELRVAEGGSYQPQISNNAAFDYTYTPRPTLLVDFRYGFGRTLLKFSPLSDGFDPTQLGLPAYIGGNADRLYFPGFSPAGYLALGANSFFRRNAFETHNWSLNNSKVLTGHLLKFGFEARLVRVNNTEASSAVGAFNFGRNFTQGPDPNRATTTAGDGMASFLVGVGDGTLTKCFKCVSTQSTYWGWYFSDDWKATGTLTLNLGIRYELEIPRHERYNRVNVFNPDVPSPLAGPAGLPNLKGGLEFAGVEGRSSQQFPADRNNFAPRFGFAYQAQKNTVLRAGFGIFYAPSLRAAGGTVGNFGYRSDTTYVGSQDGVTPTDYLRNPFPDGFTPQVGSSQGLLTAAGSSISASLKGDNVVPYSENWSFNIQQQLRGNLLVELGYVGTHALHITDTGEGTANLNQLRPEQLTLGSQLQQQVKNRFYGLITGGSLATATVPQSFLLRPFPQFTTVNPLYKTGGSSIYHSLQLKVEKRFSSGFNVLLSYTDGKLLDDFSIISNVGRNANIQNIYDRRSEWSISANDVSQRLVASFVYELPFGRGHAVGSEWSRPLNALLGGWQTNGILTLQTGQPLALSTQNTSNAGGNVLRPNSTGKSARLDGPTGDRLNRYFDTTVFTQPAPFTFGNTARTLPDVRGPGARNLDFSLFKNFALTEKIALQFRAESFNLSNTPVFGFPNQGLNNVSFGRISGTASDPRQIQFGLKLLY
ncbi:MAG: carboxypeptidase regulatory-like domain-containing protein [Acidobacteria bacterium]|nr:carboxypeptidase regulatory-like domain-containing protein [Acidobacteriota bacterium]